MAPDPRTTPHATLMMAWGASSKVTLLSTVWDRIYWEGDRDLDSMLSSVKNAPHAPTRRQPNWRG